MVTSEAQQQAALRRLYALAKDDLTAALRLVDVSDSAAVADVIVTYVPVIAERYGLAAGALAADWYDELRDREGIRGAFSAVVADLPTQGRYEALAAWTADKNDVEALVAGGLQRILANMHRETVMRSSFADPRAAGWARFSAGGDGSCPFCYMLISRGAIYTDQTAKFGAHDHCNCAAGPIWRDRRDQVDAYKKSARRREDADGKATGSAKADQDRAKAWIAENL